MPWGETARQGRVLSLEFLCYPGMREKGNCWLAVGVNYESEEDDLFGVDLLAGFSGWGGVGWGVAVSGVGGVGEVGSDGGVSAGGGGGVYLEL